jgi:iron(III) transport system permease protein
MWALTLFVAFLVLYPLSMLFWGSIAGVPPGAPAQPSFKGWVEAYSDAATYRAFANTLGLSVLRTILSVALAIFFAWVITRTDVPMKRLVELMLIAPFAAPTLLMAISWAMLASPKAGLLNQMWKGTFGVEQGPFNVYSYGGIVWVGVIQFVAIKVMLLVPAFRQMDATLEESSIMSGANRVKTFFHVTLPLMMPAVLGVTILSFIRYMESFELELVLGQPANIYVFTTQIYTLLHDFPVNYPPAMALSVTLLVLTFILAVLQARILGNKRYTTVSGKSFRTQPAKLGPFRWVVFALCVVFFLVSFALPFAVLLLNSLSPATGVYSPDKWTLANYQQVFSQTKMTSMLRNTLILGVGSATLGMLLASIVAYVIVRTEFGGKKLLDMLSWIPWTVPGIVLSIAMLWAYISLPGPIQLYGTIGILIVAVITTTLPLAVRLMIGIQVQIAKELEESSRVHGASWFQTFFHIILGLIRRGFLAGWVIVFVDAVRNLGVVVLLFSAASMPISVMIFVLWSEGQTRVVSAMAVIMLLFIMALLALQMRLSEDRQAATH